MIAMLLAALLAEAFHEARIAFEGQNYKEAARLFSPLAKEGDTLAGLYLGMMALKGRGVPKDFERAAELINAAAKAGDPVAQVSLANLYEEGLGVAKDVAQAHAWKLKAANQGYWAGQVNVAVDFAVGVSVPKDCTAATPWLEKAKASGQKIARWDIGIALFKGCGQPQDRPAGIKILRDISAEDDDRTIVEYFDKDLKDPEHVMEYAARYSFWRATQEEPPKGAAAIEWLRTRAAAGDPYAQYAYGAALENAIGVPKDAGEAALWYAKSAAQGISRSEAALSDLAKRGAINDRQLAAARSAAGGAPPTTAAPAALAAPSGRRVLALKGKLAVLDLRNYAPDLSKQSAQYFTDLVRQTSLRMEPGLEVITRENLLVLLQATGRKLEECEGECEVETGRRIGADEIVSGEILKVGSRYKLTLRLHDTAAGKLLSSAIGSGKSIDELDEGAQKAAEELFSVR